MKINILLRVILPFLLIIGCCQDYIYAGAGGVEKQECLNFGISKQLSTSNIGNSMKDQTLYGQKFSKRNIIMKVTQSNNSFTDETSRFNIILNIENKNCRSDDSFNIEIRLNSDSCLRVLEGFNNMRDIKLNDVSEFTIPIKINKTDEDKNEDINIIITRNVMDLTTNMVVEEEVKTYKKSIFIEHIPKKAIIIVPGIVGSEIFSATSQIIGGVQYAEDHRIWPPEDTSKIIKKLRYNQYDSSQCFVDNGVINNSSSLQFGSSVISNHEEGIVIDEDQNDLRQPVRVLGIDSDRLMNDFRNLICLDDGTSKLQTKNSYPFNCRLDGDKRFYGSADVYAKLSKSIMRDDDFEDYDIIFFSYDWRRSNRDTAMELKRFIDENRYSNVILIGHSMGGLVCTSYLSDITNRPKIDKFIALGTPFLGSNKAINVVESGRFFSGFIGNIIAPVADSLTKDIVKNCQSVYELFPPRQIFDLCRENILEEVRCSYLCCCFCRSERHIPVNLFDRYIDLLISRWPNQNSRMFLNRAQEFHNTLYNQNNQSILLSDDINFYNIVGYNTQTIGATQIVYDFDDVNESRLECINNFNGDGTVTLTSATLANTLPIDRSYRVKNVSHINLIKDDSVINLIKNIMTNKPRIFNDDKIDQKFSK